jgi:succinate dehydrogenase hydrophobic anchor subunit
MIRLWLAFVIFAVVIHFGITMWRKMEEKERWSLTKTAFYSIIVSLLALAVMTAIVVLF